MPTKTPIHTTEFATIDCLERELRTYRTDRVRIAAILRAFYLAELSIASVQPVLDLALELNGPDLATERLR